MSCRNVILVAFHVDGLMVLCCLLSCCSQILVSLRPKEMWSIQLHLFSISHQQPIGERWGRKRCVARACRSAPKNEKKQTARRTPPPRDTIRGVKPPVILLLILSSSKTLERSKKMCALPPTVFSYQGKDNYATLISAYLHQHKNDFCEMCCSENSANMPTLLFLCIAW